MINKTSLLSQINSAIAALNLSTAETQDLVLFLKTALNTGVDPSSLITQLTTRIQGISVSAELKELLLLVTAVKLIGEDRMLSVPDLTALNGLSNISAGTIYFVDSERIPYIKKSDGTWVIIDPSLHAVQVDNLYAWGNNNSGNLGDNTTTNRSSPVSVVGGFTDWVQVSGGSHSLGLRANGTAWAWGNNNYGRLGDNTTTNRSSPVSVVGGFTDWVQISGGYYHSLGLRANGTAWAWGYNRFGQLGDGTTTDRSSPVSVVGGFTDWVQVSSTTFHSLGVRANGTAWAWGYNGSGRLGDGTTVASRLSPVSVVGGFTDWVQVDAGGAHSLGVRANGTAWAWGFNSTGQLGDGTTTSRSSPVSVVGGFTDWVQVSAGSHSLGLRANGTAWAWGANGNGRLGDGTTTNRSSPVSVVGGFTDWVQVSGGFSHSLGVRANGSAWAWGCNNVGQLGDGTQTSRSSPVSVVGGFTDWVQVANGFYFSIAIRGSN